MSMIEQLCATVSTFSQGEKYFIKAVLLGGLLFIYVHIIYEIIQDSFRMGSDKCNFCNLVRQALRAIATGIIGVCIILVGVAECLS